jgi:hypothetical protein
MSATGLPADRLHLIGAECSIDVPAGGLEQFVTDLPARQRRTNARKEISSFAESPFYVQRTSLIGWPATLGPLLAQLNRKYGHDVTGPSMTAALAGQEQFIGQHSVLFLARHKDSGEVAGFALAYAWGRELAVRVVGFDYERFDVTGLYAELVIYEPIRFCTEEGLEVIHLGMSSFPAKLRRGAACRPLWAVASHASRPIPLETTLADVTSSFPDRERQLLVDEVTEFASHLG